MKRLLMAYLLMSCSEEAVPVPRAVSAVECVMPTRPRTTCQELADQASLRRGDQVCLLGDAWWTSTTLNLCGNKVALDRWRSDRFVQISVKRAQALLTAVCADCIFESFVSVDAMLVDVCFEVTKVGAGESRGFVDGQVAADCWIHPKRFGKVGFDFTKRPRREPRFGKIDGDVVKIDSGDTETVPDGSPRK